MIEKDAYFSGLIDGEGYVALAKKDARHIRPKIAVKMTCEKTVRAIHQYFGVGSVRLVPSRNERCKDQWEWYCLYLDAIMVATRIKPFSITKLASVEHLLTYTPVGTGNGRRTK